MTDYPEKLPREFLEQRRHLHYIYTRLASGEATEQEIKDLGIKTFERQARLPHETDFLERHHKKLSCNVSTARFYDYGQTRLELYYAVPFKELQARQQDSLVQDIPLRTSWALRDTTGTVIKNRDGYIMVSQPPDTGYYTDQINIMLSGYTYSLALELQHPFGQAADEEKIETEGFLAGREDLFLSDLQLASNIRTADPDKDKKAYIKHNLCITPYPFSQVERKKMIFVYFEIYNLHLSGGGRTDMEVSYELRSKRTGFLGRINPFSRNRTAYSTSFTQQGGKRNEQVWFALDLSRLKPDHYTIIITVKDEVAGREAKRESVIEVL